VGRNFIANAKAVKPTNAISQCPFGARFFIYAETASKSLIWNSLKWEARAAFALARKRRSRNFPRQTATA
jgi:hypothetical protein